MSEISRGMNTVWGRAPRDLHGDVTPTYFTQRESPLIVPSQECEYCAATLCSNA